MMGARDTICALASGPPPAAICVIRVSGPGVAMIGERLLKSGLPEPKRAVLTDVTDLTGEWIDEGLALYAKSPHSYTGEDTLELYLHGGVAVIEHALAALTTLPGVRLAEPGEFTRRAFEAGKLDLTEAEGVADLIEAETRGQKAQALRQVAGGLSSVYENWRDQLTGLLALTEVMIDFPDEGDVPGDAGAPLARQLAALASEMRAALGDNGVGERIREGFRVVIIGPPNAGKSTLLNRLAGRDAAIVTATPGTTRDVIEVRRMMGRHVVWLSDTAGLRDTSDAIETEGIRRALQAAETADLRVFLKAPGDPDGPGRAVVYRQDTDILVVNKSDLAPLPPGLVADFAISAKTGDGVAALETEIARRIAARAGAVEAPVITRARHREKLSAGLACLGSAQAALDSEAGFELVAEDLRLAVRHLAGVIGSVDVEDVLGAVFSRFCIGK